MQDRPRIRSIGLAMMVVATLLCLLGQALAQVGPGRELRGDAHAQRQLRAVEGRSVTQPSAAALDAANARQQLLRGRDRPLSPTEWRVDRQLENLGVPTVRPSTSLPPTQPQDELPASYDETTLLPRTGATERVANLIERAADGISEGRFDQARSDLGLAESQLDQLSDAEGATSLRQQIASLRRQLTVR